MERGGARAAPGPVSVKEHMDHLFQLSYENLGKLAREREGKETLSELAQEPNTLDEVMGPMFLFLRRQS